MVRIFKTIDGAIHEIQEPQEGCWIALTNPTATEIFEISEQFGIEVDDLRAPLDEEERSRIEVEDNYTLILADVPAIEERNEKDWYVTIPLGIIVTQKMIFTVPRINGSLPKFVRLSIPSWNKIIHEFSFIVFSSQYLRLRGRPITHHQPASQPHEG